MISLMLALASATHATGTKARALELCRPRLERKVGGEIQTIDVRSVRRTDAGLTLKGRLTANLGMGPPQPGYASTHHLIRADFDFVCGVRGNRVRYTSAKPLR